MAEESQVRKEQRDEVSSIVPLALLKSAQQYRAGLISLMEMAEGALQGGDYDFCIRAYEKALDMIEIGNHHLTNTSPHSKALIYSNLACCYQTTRNLSKCNKFCEKYQGELEGYLQVEDSAKALKFIKMLIKSKLQQCAIVSQMEAHTKAIELCESACKLMNSFIRILRGITKEMIMAYEPNTVMEKMQFSHHVAKYAEEILSDLEKVLNQPPNFTEKVPFYYWERNPERNQEQIKKQYGSKSENTYKKTILGVTRTEHWVEQFNIGSIMHIGQQNIAAFDQILPLNQYLFKDKLYEIVIYCSLAQFTLAIELRFIEFQRNKTAEGKKNKYLQQKSQIHKKSQLFHLRAIKIIAKNIASNMPYLTHLINSYNKHYISQKNLQPIMAINDESIISSKFSESIPNKVLPHIFESIPPPQQVVLQNQIQLSKAFKKNKQSEDFIEAYKNSCEDIVRKSKSKSKHQRETSNTKINTIPQGMNRRLRDSKSLEGIAKQWKKKAKSYGKGKIVFKKK